MPGYVTYHDFDQVKKEEIFQDLHSSLALAQISLEHMLSINTEQMEKNKLEQLHGYIRDILEISNQFLGSFSAENFNHETREPGEKISQKKSPDLRKQNSEDVQAFISQLNQVMEQNFSDPDFNVERLAKKLNISGATLYRKITAQTGETSCDFIRSYRLQRAMQLLESHFGTVMDVAFEVGFNSPSYFTRCFRAKFHRLPSDLEASTGFQPDE